MILRSLAAIVALTALVSVARADEAPPEPASLTCPRGAIGALPTIRPGEIDPRGRAIRPWPYCAATTCTADADCTDGRVCSAEEIGLCVEDHAVEGGDAVRAARERGCEPDGTCLNVHSTCERARRCVDAPPAAPPPTPTAPAAAPAPAAAAPAAPPPSDSGCRASPRSPSGAFTLVVSALMMLARRRSRPSGV